MYLLLMVPLNKKQRAAQIAAARARIENAKRQREAKAAARRKRGAA